MSSSNGFDVRHRSRALTEGPERAAARSYLHGVGYSAEDLVLVQRDIGRLVQYTLDMGGGAELLEVALRIPPWEPMRLLSRDELRRTRLDTSQDRPAPTATVPVSSSGVNAPTAPVPLNDSTRSEINPRGWVMTERAGASIGPAHVLMHRAYHLDLTD